MDLWGKYYYISVRAEIVLALAGLLLFLVFPSRINRTLFIAADSGESRVCYYIPGKLISAEAFQGEISEVRVEAWEGGSLLAFSLEKSPGEEEITEVSIEFQYLGVLPRGQAALAGENSFLEWTEEKAALQYAVPEEGYLFAARQEGDYNTGHFYSLEESSWNHQRWNLFGGLLLGSAYFLLADLAARFGRRRRRLENRKYWKLDELSGEYILAARTRTDPPLLRRNRSVFKRLLCFQFLQRLLLLAVAGQWLARLLDCSLDRSFITSSLALILLSVLLYYGLYCWFYLSAYKRILSLGEQNPSGAAVCFLDLRFISAPVPQWVLSDLNFAVFMMRSGYYRESALFAGELWRRFGKNQKQGRQYLQYQYVQFCSFHYMGKEEQAARYLERAQSEIERNPRDKYSRKITARLEEIQETEGLSGFGSGLPSEGSPASRKEVKEP